MINIKLFPKPDLLFFLIIYTMDKLIGKKFGRLIVKELTYRKDYFSRTENRNKKIKYYLCVCDCGNTKIVSRNSLINGLC